MNINKAVLLQQTIKLEIVIDDKYHYSTIPIEDLSIGIIKHKYIDGIVTADTIVQINDCVIFFNDKQGSIYKIIKKGNSASARLINVINKDNDTTPNLIYYTSKAIILGYTSKSCNYSLQLQGYSNLQNSVTKYSYRLLAGIYFISEFSHSSRVSISDINKSFIVGKTGDYCIVTDFIIKDYDTAPAYHSYSRLFSMLIAKRHRIVVINTQGTYYVLNAHIQPILSSESAIEIMDIVKIKRIKNIRGKSRIMVHDIKSTNKTPYIVIRDTTSNTLNTPLTAGTIDTQQGELHILKLYSLDSEFICEFTSTQKIISLSYEIDDETLCAYSDTDSIVAQKKIILTEL